MKYAPLQKRIWASPVFWIWLALGLIAYPQLLIGLVSQLLDGEPIIWSQLAIVVAAPMFPLFWFLQSWWTGSGAFSAVQREASTWESVDLWHIRFGLSGARDLGELFERPLFLKGNLRALLMPASSGLVFWNAETVEREVTLPWSHISSIELGVFDSAIWRSRGIRIICESVGRPGEKASVCFEVRSKLFAGAFPSSHSRLSKVRGVLEEGRISALKDGDAGAVNE